MPYPLRGERGGCASGERGPRRWASGVCDGREAGSRTPGGPERGERDGSGAAAGCGASRPPPEGEARRGPSRQRRRSGAAYCGKSPRAPARGIGPRAWESTDHFGRCLNRADLAGVEHVGEREAFNGFFLGFSLGVHCSGLKGERLGGAP